MLAGLKLSGFVNDQAGVLGMQDAAALSSLLGQLQQTDSTQVVVLTVRSTEGQPIEQYALEVARENGIGQADTSNGVLVVVAVDDRKMRIEVGRGLEGRLTDAIASQIIRHQMAPRFKQGDLSGGTRAGVEAVVSAVKGEYVAPASDAMKGLPSMLIWLGVGCFVVALGLRAIGRPLFAWALAPVWMVAIWLLAHVTFNLSAIVAGLVTSFAVTVGSRRGYRSGFWYGGSSSVGGFGGGSFGGGSSGGGFSGGGFSGGGGGFSGGGSSGSW